MAQPRKYEGISDDLDTAPDIYETPDLTDDTSTLPASSIPRPSSAGSSYEDASEGELTSGISQSRLQPNKAREQFFSNNVDAREVDFSDRVSSNRRSYRTSHRRKRKGDTENNNEELSDEDESLEQRLARLRREVDEVKAAYDSKNYKDDHVNKRQSHEEERTNEAGGVAQLSRMLDEMHSNQRSKTRSDMPFGLQNLHHVPAIPVSDQNSSVPKDTDSAKHTKFTVEYAPSYEQSHALAKAADLDSRLALLEKYIGKSFSNIPGDENTNVLRPVLPTLETLEHQLMTLSTTTPSSLDAISRKVHEALQETKHLDDLRKQSRNTQDSARPGGERGQQDTDDDNEQSSKINALYGTLPTIETLAPLLPSVLDRLHTLRAVHASAARASESLDAVEVQQQEMEEEIKKWTEGLEKVEQNMKSAEDVRVGNVKVVEGWVKDLEERLKRME